MLKAIPRYGARVIPDTEELVDAIHRAGQFLEGPHIQAFAATVPGAEATEQAVQIPVYESLSTDDVARVATVVHDAALVTPAAAPAAARQRNVAH